MDQYGNFEFEDEQGQETGKGLRDARDAAAKEAKEAKAELAKLQKQLTERNLKDVLQSKSLNPGLAKWIAQDGVDGSDPAKVDEWLSSNAELIGYKPNINSTEEQGEPDARAAAFERMQGVQQNALPTDKFTEAVSALNGDKELSFEEASQVLRRAAGLGG